MRIICTDRASKDVPCVGLVDWDGHEVISNYEKDGTGTNNCDLVREYDPLGELPVDTLDGSECGYDVPADWRSEE